jgi:hypothetical protein
VITPPKDQSADELQSALSAARENENRWLEISPEVAADSQGMEQWASTAKLRRLEVERLEALLAGLPGPSSSPQPHVPHTADAKCRLGETG